MPVISVRAAIEALGSVVPESIKRELSVDEIQYSGEIVVAASQTETVAFTQITTATFVFFRFNSAITYKLNGGSDDIVVASGGFVLMFNCSVTALSITETAAAEMRLEVMLGGT